MLMSAIIPIASAQGFVFSPFVAPLQTILGEYADFLYTLRQNFASELAILATRKPIYRSV
jgi:hypothetical protein